MMHSRVNTYFAMLIVTIVGAIAAHLILQVALSDQQKFATAGSIHAYDALQKTLLQTSPTGKP